MLLRSVGGGTFFGPFPGSVRALNRSAAKKNHTTARFVRRDVATKETKMAIRKTKSKTSKRTVIEPKKGDRRYVRRNKKGEFKKQVKVGKSLAADRKRSAKTKVKKGQGDRGDVKR
jgi:hypothetical protein